MDGTLSKNVPNYEALEETNPENRFSNANFSLDNGKPATKLSKPPENNGVYVSFILAGLAILLPYNSFITAVDYYHNRFPGSPIEFDMSLVYLCVLFVGVCVVNCLVRVVSIKTRVSAGYTITIATLLLITLLDIWFQVFDNKVSYYITLLAIALVAAGTIMQQSSFYGYTSMLPPRYTQAVLTGESLAGVVVSIDRIITKAAIPNQRTNTVTFFFLSIFILLTSFVVFHIMIRTKFVTFYLSRCIEASLPEDRKRFASAQSDDVSLVEVSHSLSADQMTYKVLVVDVKAHSTAIPENSTPDSNDGQFCQIVQSDSNYSNVSKATSTVSFRHQHSQPCCMDCLGSVRDGFNLRLETSRYIWTYMLTISTAYFITLCLFPGILSEITNCTLKSWLPIILISLLNLGDFLGKIVSSIPYDWPRFRLLGVGLLRLIFIPLLMLCASPRAHPVLDGVGWSIVFSLSLGLTNGYFGSVPMILAASRVPEDKKEICGNIMMVSYSFGLTTGSIVSYMLKAFLGPNVPLDYCAIASNVTVIP